MDTQIIISKMNAFLHEASKVLYSWLYGLLPRVTDNWWDECVMPSLSFTQHEIAVEKCFSKLSDFDLAALLRIANKSWYDLQTVIFLPSYERETIRKMIDVRNNWAHCSTELPGKDTILQDLNTLLAFMEQFDGDKNSFDEINKFIKFIEQPDSLNLEPYQIESKESAEVTQTSNEATATIHENSLVYLVSDPKINGVVLSLKNLGDITQYNVFVNNEIQQYYTGQIALVEKSVGYNWISLTEIRSYLTAYQINNPSSQNLYSLNSARIDFVPYQFRPALKMIHADEPRILIADSVGVGKTIEAGLIIKELEARSDLERVLVICPKPLVAERKWELEMKRFDEEFIPLDGTTLRQIISDTDRDGDWPVRFNKVIIPYSILDSKVYNGESGRRNRIFGLSELDPEPHFDLVIVDEAHHIRNGSDDKEKAFAYKCTKYFCDHADAVVMLTATPLQTSDNDLFTLLNVLRPDIVVDKDTFDMMSRPNANISRAVHLVRAMEEGWNEMATTELLDLQKTQWGDNVIAENPLYNDILRRLESAEIDREERVKLISDIESLHSFGTMLNRTRRRDIQDFCVRRSHTVSTSFTEYQQKLHDELLCFEHEALATLHNANSVAFMISTVRRQAASCIFGLAPYIRDIISRRLMQLDYTPDIDISNEDIDDKSFDTITSLAKNILRLSDNLPDEDPKFEETYNIICKKQEQSNNKIMIFSTFRHTLSYLRRKLSEYGLIVCHVPFKLDASREFVDPQDNNLWFQEASKYLSELMDKLYLDYSHEAKENIVCYLPDKSKSLFANNNGKEKCLTVQNCFNGAHFLDLPIFYTIDGYKKSDEIFCFSENENIEEPEKVYRLMGYHRSLFISPIPVTRFSITVVTGVKHKMFKKALDIADRTSDILDYLDSVNYNYPEQLIRKLEPIKISQAQLHIIINHKELSKAFQSLSCHDIRINRRFRLEITDADVQTITDLLDDEFEMSDIPRAVRNYMEYCQNKCICFDESSELYMPCYNAIWISSQKPLSSFLSFCRDIDPNDPFTTRITWREKSSELNKYVEDATISESEYMRVLRQIRLSIRDSLGNEGYRSYLDIILKSGTDRGRFIQELLQNADDCFYEQDTTPTFSLSVNGSTIVTEYNEIGFTRANIRSITAIGESTKKKLLTHRSSSIGEKGVGFKTIFAIASKVTIHSGDYHFSLSDKEPTIPKLIGEAVEPTPGTKMEIALKNNEVLHSFKEKEILELCLCLRNLKKLTIGKHTILISDTDDKRTITIGTRNYSFKRFYHNFDITDESAIEERKNGSREISTYQQIVCYVPEFSVEKNYDFPLYCGLPTKHKIKIPMAIDAPFSLTTSREEIETEGSKWNDIIRREMYVALMKVIDSLKINERSNVFKYLKFVPRFQGTIRAYVNDTFDNKYLNGYDLLSQLLSKEIIPTYNHGIFAVPIQNTAHRYPEAAIYIITKLSLSEYEEIDSSSIIDIDSNDYDSVLNALSCEEADFSMALPILFKYAERFIQDEVFRKAFYEYIAEAPADYTPKIKDLQIIPVYGIESNTTKYISWKEKSIYVKRNETRSGTDHYILNEHQMPKSLCEKIYSDNINEWSHEIERVKYNDRLEALLCEENDIAGIYSFLLTEYRSGRLLKNGSFKILSSYNVPLKNQCNEITCNQLFVCDLSNYFTTEMIMGISVHDECRGLAKDIGIESLSCIHYEDIQYDKELTANDIEELIDDPNHYFLNYEELLRGFYRDGLLPEELLQEYELDYLSYGGYDATDYTYDFPSEQVENRTALASHIKKLCKTPVRIITVEEMCKVQKIKTYDDRVYPYDRSYSRNIILNTYSPEGSRDLCFCQMCLKPKPKVYIEVNSIDILPEFFFSQLRLSLCLECSKRFEALRRNESIRKAFIRCIKEYVITDEGTVEIPIGNFDSITFTAKHLAEIQEIFRQIPPKHK